MKKTPVGFGASSMEGIGDDTGGGFFKRIQPAFENFRFVNLGVLPSRSIPSEAE